MKRRRKRVQIIHHREEVVSNRVLFEFLLSALILSPVFLILFILRPVFLPGLSPAWPCCSLAGSAGRSGRSGEAIYTAPRDGG